MLDNLQSADFDRIILDVAVALFGKTPRLEKCLSYINYCAVLSFDDGTADRVVKLTNKSRRDIEVEQRLYPAMRACGLPVPQIEFTEQDYTGACLPFMVMPRFSPYTLKQVCNAGGATALQACGAAGGFIRDLPVRFGDAFETLRRDEAVGVHLAAIQSGVERTPDLGAIRDLAPDLVRNVERYMATLARPATRCLTHGQPHVRNILADDDGQICAVDFATVGMASPLRDLFTLLNSHDGWSKGTGDPAQRRAIVDGYGGLNEAAVQELHYWECFYWAADLCLYLPRARQPQASSFDRQQADFISERARAVVAGEGLVNRL